MKINLDNYEAFFLDYKEGNLSAEQEKELFLFLEEYPHLGDTLHAYEEISLEPGIGEEIFGNKGSLKKTIFTNENLIAYTEGILDERSKSDIDVLSYQNSSFRKELELYKSTRVEADLSIKFPNKSKLKRGGVVIALQNNFTFLRVAAAILLLIGLFFLATKLTTKVEIKKNNTEVADASKKEVGSEKEAVSSKQSIKNSEVMTNQDPSYKNATASNNTNNSAQQIKKQKNVQQVIPQPEIQNVVTNAVQTNNAVANNTNSNVPKDSVGDKIIVVTNNNMPEVKDISKSYFNYSADDEDENTQPVTASVTSEKKSFFQKLVKVAKNVNNMGVKKINAAEKENTNLLTIGGLVVAETTSN